MDTNGHNPPPHTEVNPLAMAQGHEPDKIDSRAIIYVPIVLGVCFLLSWLTVDLLINYLRAPSTEKPANELAAVHNAEPINERLGRINSSTPLAEVREPRLEGLNQIDTNGQKPFVRSFEPTTAAGNTNSPHYHPEDLRPSSEFGKKLGLQSYSWIKKDELARIPVLDALKIVLNTKNSKSLSGKFIAVQQKDGKPVQLSDLLKLGPTAANPQGQTSPQPPGPHSHDGDHGAHP